MPFIPCVHTRILSKKLGGLFIGDVRVELKLDEREVLKGYKRPDERRSAINAVVSLQEGMWLRSLKILSPHPGLPFHSHLRVEKRVDSGAPVAHRLELFGIAEGFAAH